MTQRNAAYELNVDGLPGPTHNYAGLAPGNLASQAHKHDVSNPRAAALQALDKMKRVADLGVPQAVLPPQARPDVNLLRRLGFAGADGDVLTAAQRDAPALLAAASSASSMWAANAATVCPSADAMDQRVHITPANLCASLHRAIEPRTTAALLRALFPDERVFMHHDPLPGSLTLRDEGAANHTRLCASYGEPGVQLFVYGRRAMNGRHDGPRTHPARQTAEASEAITRLHQMRSARMVFAQQHPDAIDAGVFHNDVAAVGDGDLFFYHADAFVNIPEVSDRLRRTFEQTCGGPLTLIEIDRRQLSLSDAVRTYLFNSQIVRDARGRRVLIAPQECAEDERVRALVGSLTGANAPFQAVAHVDLRQSMRNGGGPACLRLRVALTEQELASVHRAARLTDERHAQLTAWIHRHYREELRPQDLADPALLRESRAALDELTRLLELGDVYPFQRTG